MTPEKKGAFVEGLSMEGACPAHLWLWKRKDAERRQASRWAGQAHRHQARVPTDHRLGQLRLGQASRFPLTAALACSAGEKEKGAEVIPRLRALSVVSFMPLLRCVGARHRLLHGRRVRTHFAAVLEFEIDATRVNLTRERSGRQDDKTGGISGAHL